MANRAPESPARALRQALTHYREPNAWRSFGEIAVTFVPLAGLWLVMWLAIAHGHWQAVILAVPAAGFLVRLFMI